MRLLIVVNKAQIYPVNIRCRTHYTSTHITQSIKLGYHILVYSVKREELHAHKCKKYPRTCPSTMTKSTEFFLFTMVFLQPFALSLSFFSLVFFLCVSPLNPFFRIIYYGFYTISSIHVWVRCWEFFFSVLSCLSLNLPLLAVRLLVHCSGITSTLMRSES